MMIIYIHIHKQWWWYVFMQSNEAAPLVHCAPASILLPHVAGYFRRPRGAFRSFFNDDHDDDHDDDGKCQDSPPQDWKTYEHMGPILQDEENACFTSIF